MWEKKKVKGLYTQLKQSTKAHRRQWEHSHNVESADGKVSFTSTEKFPGSLYL